jgi:multidrug efflux pump subunit AcrB
MGLAYAVGLVLIYLLVVAQFGSYLVPLIIMAPIPLTIIGVMPGHALLGAQFTATSMIGMIALAGIIVRNSILLVDFIDCSAARACRSRRHRALGHHARPAHRADRARGDARRRLHPRRPDLQRAGDLADLRHLRCPPC